MLKTRAAINVLIGWRCLNFIQADLLVIQFVVVVLTVALLLNGGSACRFVFHGVVCTMGLRCLQLLIRTRVAVVSAALCES